MADLLYSYSKAAYAVERLVTGKGPIKERLLDACQEAFVQIDREVLPGDMKSVYDEIRDLVRGEPQPLRGAYAPKIEKLSDDEARQAAVLMHELAERLRVFVV